MGIRLGPKLATHKAEKIISELGIKKPPIDPIKIAELNDIVVQAKPMDQDGVSGMLLHTNNNFGILYATNIQSEGFQRFSIAHELGHYFLDGHSEILFRDSEVHQSHAGSYPSNDYEKEADHFAAGLLMPEGLFRPAAIRLDTGLQAIESLATLFNTSLTATAIRYMEFCDDIAGIIVSSNGVINFFGLSDKLKAIPNVTWPKIGARIPRDTATAKLSGNQTQVESADRAEAEVDLQLWFDGDRDIAAVEQVIGLGNYGKTLTVISCTEEPSDDFNEEDEDLIESWTPRFKK